MDMRNTNWKNLLITTVLIVLGLGWHMDVQAQRDKWRFFWNVGEEYNEDAVIHLGIHFNYYHSHYFFEKNPNWDNLSVPANGGQFTSINSKSGHGVGLGIPLDYKINNRLNLTLSPTFVVLQGTRGDVEGEIKGFRLAYGYEDGTEHIAMQNLESNFPAFDLPLHLKLRSDPKYFGNSPNPYKVYLLAGGKWTNTLSKNQYDLMSPGTVPHLPLIFKKQHFSAEVGLGIDFIFPYFKLSPEIRFSQSIGNLIDHKHPLAYPADNPYVGAINKLGLRSFQFSLIFE